MSEQERFSRIYAEVCERRGWVSSSGQVDVKLDDGRHQIVRLEFFEHDGRELVRLATTIGSTRRIRTDKLADALRTNYRLPHGALAVHEDHLMMVDTLVVADADPGEVESSILFLAQMADQLEATMFGPDEH